MEAIARADLIILLGTRMNFPLGFGREPFMSSGQRVIQVDIEPSEIGRYREVDLGIQGDVSACLDWWTDRGIQMQPMEKWLAEIEKSRTNFERKLKPLKLSNRKPIHPLRLVQDIADSRSDDSILCLDGANSLLWNFNITDRPPEGQTIISPIGELESIGAGIPHALAMKLEHPDREVILHVGDGSFGYHAMEFETAVRYGIPIVCIVHNDRGWGMTRDMQMDFFGSDREIGNTLGDVRYDLLVESLGGYGELVNSPEDIAPAIGRAIYSGLPACVNVMVDPEPKSPGLALFMLLEMMLGQETVYDKIPDIVRKFERLHLDGMISKLMLKYVDRMLHRAMK
jgi:acetolactate synthase-1/2/3 large subunit